MVSSALSASSARFLLVLLVEVDAGDDIADLVSATALRAEPRARVVGMTAGLGIDDGFDGVE